MFGSDLIIGIAITLGALAVFAVIAVLVLRRQGRHARHDHGSVPPPVDPGSSEPEQARDVHSEETDRKDGTATAG